MMAPTKWTSAPRPFMAGTWSVTALAGDGANLWLAAQALIGTAYHPSFLELTNAGIIDALIPAQELRSIWVAEPNHLFVTLQMQGLSNLSGSSIELIGSPNAELGAVTGLAHEVWTTRLNGPATIYHWDGLNWDTHEFGPNLSLHDVQAGPDGSIWTVGDAGFMARFKDGNWSTRYSGTSDLFVVWPTAAEEVWVAGAEGTLLHRASAESGWERVPMGSGSLHGLWGRTVNDVWLVGDQGLVRHWDGREWQSVVVPTRERLLAVTGTRDRIWIGGEMTLLYGAIGSR